MDPDGRFYFIEVPKDTSSRIDLTFKDLALLHASMFDDYEKSKKSVVQKICDFFSSKPMTAAGALSSSDTFMKILSKTSKVSGSILESLGGVQTAVSLFEVFFANDVDSIWHEFNKGFTAIERAWAKNENNVTNIYLTEQTTTNVKRGIAAPGMPCVVVETRTEKILHATINGKEQEWSYMKKTTSVSYFNTILYGEY